MGTAAGMQYAPPIRGMFFGCGQCLYARRDTIASLRGGRAALEDLTYIDRRGEQPIQRGKIDRFDQVRVESRFF